MQFHQDCKVEFITSYTPTICSLTLLQELSADKKAITWKKHNGSQTADRKIKERERSCRKNGWVEGESVVLAILPEHRDRAAEWEQASLVPLLLIMECSHHLDSWTLVPLILCFYSVFPGKTNAVAVGGPPLSNDMTFGKQTRLAWGVGVKQQWVWKHLVGGGDQHTQHTYTHACLHGSAPCC